MEPQKPFHEAVAEKLIDQLKAGTAPWQRKLEPGEPNSCLPMNPATGKRYKGINAVHLMAQGHSDSRWMTYKQANALGAEVRAGEKGTLIQYWKFSEEQDKFDDKGSPILDAEGHRVKESVKLERPHVFFATVFNGEQIDGLPQVLQKAQTEQTNNRAENILNTSGATIIHHGENNRAFYQAETDSIHLPDKDQFLSNDNYYATALHELGHWTGHPSRLDRDQAHPFGSEGYAKEELRAEIASMILGDALGIGHSPKQHTAYAGSWIKILQDDPKEIFRASSEAEKIYDSVLAFEQKQVQSQDQVNSHETSLQPPKTDADAQSFNAEQKLHEQQYIAVPYEEKDEAKGLGARWDRQQQSWYVPQDVDVAPFAKWGQGAAPTGVEAQALQLQSHSQTREHVYLAVPYDERVAAKAAGALWDTVTKSWYIGPEANMEKLEHWKPNNVSCQQGPAMTPREEFAETLRLFNCQVTGEHPIMDGKKHRISVEGDKKGELAGFYVGHLDGHPAGYIKNNRTNLDMKWKSKGYSLDPQKKAKLQTEAAMKLVERAAERGRVQEAAAQRVSQEVNKLEPIVKLTPYLQAKGIQAHPGALTDKDGLKTYIPIFDVNGKQWSMQTIQEDNTKRFAKDSRKEGCFHPFGGMKAIASALTLVIAEGYATAASLAEALGQPTVAALDAGNLLPVASALHEKFPEKPIIIAGDDDRHLEAARGINPGRIKAEEAAKAVGGKAIFPVFAPGEQALSSKEFTDFNDLATKSKLGKEAVQRQVGGAISKIISDKSQRKNLKKLEQKQHRPQLVKKIG